MDQQQQAPGDEEMIGPLERDQLVADREHPLPRASLGRGSQIALWSLRIFVIVVGAIVIYTFFAQL